MADEQRVQLLLEAVDKASATLDGVNNKIVSLKGSTEKLGGGFEGLGMIAAKFLGPAAIGAAFVKIIGEASESERAINSLKASVETAGGSWGTLEKKLIDYATQLQNTTRYSDEEVMGSMQKLITLTGDSTQSWKGAALAADLAAGSGMGLEQATKAIAFAMSGNIQMLGKVVPELKGVSKAQLEGKSAAEKAAYALEVLQEKYGGRAQKDAAGFSGSMAQMWNSLSDLAEIIGTAILPTLTEMIRAFTEAARWISGPLGSGIAFLADIFGTLYAAEKKLVGMLIDYLTPAFGWLAEKLAFLSPLVKVATEALDKMATGVKNAWGFFSKWAKSNEKDVAAAGAAVDKTAAATTNWGEVARITAGKVQESNAEIDKSQKTLLESWKLSLAQMKAGRDVGLQEELAYWQQRLSMGQVTGDQLIALEKTIADAKKAVRDKDIADFISGINGGYDIIKQITEKFASYIGSQISAAFAGTNIGGMLESVGLSAGGIFGAVGGLIVSGFMSLFGNQKSYGEMVADHFEWLSERANTAIESIGKEKTFAQQKIDVLKSMKVGPGGTYQGEAAGILGVTGLTEIQAQKKVLLDYMAVLNKQKGLLNQSEAQTAAELADYKKQMTTIVSRATGGQFTGEQWAKMSMAEKVSSGFYGAVEAQTMGLQSEIQSREDFLARPAIERLNILKDLIDTQNELTTLMGSDNSNYPGGSAAISNGKVAGNSISISDGAFVLSGIDWTSEDQKKQVAKSLADYISQYTSDQTTLPRGGVRAF